MSEQLLERGRELSALAALVERAAAGDGRCAVIEGPAGIGKTFLLGEARRRAGDDMRILAARGSDLEREFPEVKFALTSLTSNS